MAVWRKVSWVCREERGGIAWSFLVGAGFARYKEGCVEIGSEFPSVVLMFEADTSFGCVLKFLFHCYLGYVKQNSF